MAICALTTRPRTGWAAVGRVNRREDQGDRVVSLNHLIPALCATAWLVPASASLLAQGVTTAAVRGTSA
jgi:hypothetical protein